MLTRTSPVRWALVSVLLLCTQASPPPAEAADQPQWGRWLGRNMVSDETNLPEAFDPATGKNIKWSARLGSLSYGTPVVARGKVLVGTNNGRPRDARHMGDRGVLMCFDEKTGKFLWQLVVPKLAAKYADWRNVGVSSPPTVEGDRVYLMTNRGAVVCLDLAGQANGNDGPFRDEGRLMAARQARPMEVRKTDADILWRFDTPAEVGSRQHDTAHCSALVHGPFVYVSTCNGVDATHRSVPAPRAPSLVVLDKRTGRLVATDAERIGAMLTHAMWSSPASGQVGGRALVFFGGGDAVCYAFEALRALPAAGPVKLRTVWRFDCDPAGPKVEPLRFQDNRSQGASVIIGMPVFHEGRVYVTAGGDFWHGKRQAWLKCIDPRGTGDITKANEVWSCPLSRHCMSTPSIKDGLVYIADCGQQIQCLDAATGRPCWTHRTRGGIWGSTLVADGKVYVGTVRGEFCILAAGREKKVLATVRLPGAMYATPVAANGVLYVVSKTHLHAVQAGGT